MRKKHLTLLLFSIILVVLAACGGNNNANDEQSESHDSHDTTSNSAEETITLRFADYMPNTHFASVNAQQKWIDRVEELSEGRIEIEFFPGEQLGKAADTLDLVTQGAADIGNVPQAYVSNQMKLTSVTSLPGLIDSAEHGTFAAYELINSDPVYEEDFVKNGVVPVFGYTSGPYELWTVDKPVENLEDLKGLKIRSQGGSANLQIEKLGATPVSVSTAEQYEALERGTIDGTLFTTSSIPSYNLQEVVNYATVGAGGGPTLVFFIMNLDKWNSLPNDLQGVIQQATEEVLEEFVVKFDENDINFIESAKENGEIEFFEVDKDEFSMINTEVQELWVEENSDIPARETLDLFRELLGK